MRKILALSLGIVVTAACNTTIAASWETRQIGSYDTGVYIPDTQPILGNKRALMINLRGCSQGKDKLISRGNWEPTADDYGMIVAIPGNGTSCLGYAPSPMGGLAHTGILQVIETLKSDTSLNIDEKQIYVSGLSAGGTVAMEMGCRYPETVAGVGVASAPSTGSSQMSAMSAPSMSAAQVSSYCEGLAGTKKSFFNTQIASLISGKNGSISDGIVYSSWTPISTDAYASIYGTPKVSGDTTIPGVKTGGDGTEALATDDDGNLRISRIFVPSMGHAWSSGKGDGGPGSTYSGDFVDGDKINYSEYLTSFMFENNLRVTQEEVNQAPEVSGVSASENGDSIIVQATAKDSDGTIASIIISITGQDDTPVATDGTNQITFTQEITGLANGTYSVFVTAIDDEGKGKSSDPIKVVIDVEEEEDNTPPTINFTAKTNEAGSCLIVNGTASDTDGSVTDVVISISGNGEDSAIIEQSGDTYSFTYNNCNLAAGDYQITARAIDDDQDESAEANGQNVSINETVSSGPQFTTFDVTAKNGCIEIHAIAEDDEEVVYIQYKINGDTSAKIVNLIKGTSQELTITNKCNYAPGEHTVTVTAQDNDQIFKIEQQTVIMTEGQEENTAPEFGSFYAIKQGDACIFAKGTVTDTDKDDLIVNILFNASSYEVAVDSNDNSFEKEFCELEAGVYSVSATANDGANPAVTIAANDVTIEEVINSIPEVTQAVVNAEGNCFGIMGEAIDSDGTINDISIQVNGVNYAVDFAPGSTVNFGSQKCELAGGEYDVEIIATDNDGAKSATTYRHFTIVTDEVIDTDGDGVADSTDNCPVDSNSDQADVDGDGIGDVCDSLIDTDGDGVADSIDNCPADSNSDQADVDGDGIGDVCDSLIDTDGDGVADSIDNCPADSNSDQADVDGDGIGDVCDSLIDSDDDGVADSIDNCPVDSNSDQADVDGDGIGDVCDSLIDTDGDGVADSTDNCPVDSNSDQADVDGDGIGDVCDSFIDADSDGDGIADSTDNCPVDSNSDQADVDGDGIGDVCDSFIDADSDGDGVADSIDNCPVDSNSDQADVDGDGIGDVCDSFIDADGDGVADSIDNCPVDSNSDQADVDGDGIGDVCDSLMDSDDDGVADSIDNCPVDSNSDQIDVDGDDIGDVCDSLIDSDDDGVADEDDAFPEDPEETVDTDGDGTGDNADAFPEDPSKSEPDTSEDNDGGSGESSGGGGSGGGGGGGAPSLILLALGLVALRLRKRS